MGVPQRLVKVAGGIGLEDRGIVDEQGQRAEKGGGAGDQRGALGTPGEVGLENFGVAALAADAGTHRPGPGGVGAIVNDDGISFHGQREGDGRADAVPGAGDEGNGAGLIRNGLNCLSHPVDLRPDGALLQSARVAGALLECPYDRDWQQVSICLCLKQA